MPDLRETSPVSSPIRFVPFLHKYVTSLTPPLLTLPALVFSASKPLLRTGSAGEKKGEGRGREGERERETYRHSSIPPPRTMAGGPIILPADPWEPSDVSVEVLQSLVDDGLLRPITDPIGRTGLLRWASQSRGHTKGTL